MSERLEAAFVFGSLGNLSEALGDGWSVEDNYAWAVGEESRLRLPLPGGAMPCVLRLTVHPFIQAGRLDSQRLSVDTAAGPLASFSVDRRTTIELALPIELTRNNRYIELILRHPDGAQPSDFGPSDDDRLLSLCFMSGTLSRQGDDASEGLAQAVPICRVVVAGSDLARQIAMVMNALPVVRQRVSCHFASTDKGSRAAPPPMQVLQSAALCWEQSGSDEASGWSVLRSALPDDCEMRSFAAPWMSTLWPFLGADPRLTTEAGLYPAGRYRYGDRIGASLAYLQLPDDIMQLSYQSMTEKEMPDLDALLTADRTAWRRLDAMHDVKVADFIVENFRRYRLFFAPPLPTGELLRHMVLQLVTGSPVEALCDPAKLRQELDFLLTGYIGRREQLPIHPLVAQRLGLAWWHPGMRYHWHGNHWTFEEYALHYIRWTPWRT
jgi:hypothetical protein